jgi:hypothetical protein
MKCYFHPKREVVGFVHDEVGKINFYMGLCSECYNEYTSRAMKKK